MKKTYKYADYLKAVENDPEFKNDYSAIKHTYAARFMLHDERIKKGESTAPLYLK